MTHLAIALGLAGALAALPHQDDGPDGRPPIELREGDRIVLLGDALIERMQDFGDLEAILTAAHPDQTITFRNLGWSGDTVFGEARAGFGTPEDGFKELVAQVEAAAPSLLIVGYGANESWAGEQGLPRFREGYGRLLDALEATGAREIVLLSPIAQRGPNPLDPFGELPHNRDIQRYAEAIGQISRERGHRFIDLFTAMTNRPTRSLADIKDGTPPPMIPLSVSYSDDGIHLDEPGQESLARWLSDRLFGAVSGAPHARITVGEQIAIEATHGSIADVTLIPGGIRFQFKRTSLPDREPALGSMAQGTIRVDGLPEGLYRVSCDGEPLRAGHGTIPPPFDDRLGDHGDSGATRVGITVVPGSFPVEIAPDREQFEALRRAIIAKNRLYFHRYRPQNSTYLFGFRKHEQGNNAVEVEQFERLVAEAEAEIARLKVPAPHEYQLVRIAEEDDDR
ncbi:SGNH/GDSL hydrolase family protein [Tautonia sociabilis]|uniref:SGNH hydrolase-type esterase domain-containing protein n=1 Tax=Tautonia sociabilis TaxID=2080755 RepID=A0A432MM99_9BACT|nr:SGNH/GDSL hydrolase family protein [Tautonia sociabilis]RUL88317.1 hypothetical protein TsocGM_08270 [Tautonia sociabilis]